MVQWRASGTPSAMATFMSKDQPEASSSAEVANSCAIARGIMPCCAGVPSIVCVLPEPVAPASRHMRVESRANLKVEASMLLQTPPDAPADHAPRLHTVSKDADSVAIQR